MNIWLALTVIFAVTTAVGIIIGKVRNEDINDDNTTAGLVTSIGCVGVVVFGLMSLLCLLG